MNKYPNDKVLQERCSNAIEAIDEVTKAFLSGAVTDDVIGKAEAVFKLDRSHTILGRSVHIAFEEFKNGINQFCTWIGSPPLFINNTMKEFKKTKSLIDEFKRTQKEQSDVNKENVDNNANDELDSKQLWTEKFIN
jgi:hypothetical protein